MRKEYIEAGKIVTTHGVRGEVKLYPWCDDPEMFLDIETIYLDAKGQKPLALEGVRFAKNMPLLKIEGVNSIDEAAKLRDKIIYIHRDDIPMEEGGVPHPGPDGPARWSMPMTVTSMEN